MKENYTHYRTSSTDGDLLNKGKKGPRRISSEKGKKSIQNPGGSCSTGENNPCENTGILNRKKRSKSMEVCSDSEEKEDDEKKAWKKVCNYPRKGSLKK